MTRPAFLPRLMRPSEAAAYLGVSESTLRILPLTPKKLRTMTRYDIRDLDAYADSLKHGEGNAWDEMFEGSD